MTSPTRLRRITQLGLGLCFGALLWSLIARKTEQLLVEATQQELHTHLMAYFEEHESYVRLNRAPAGKLVAFFELTGQLEQRPVNPATGEPYTLLENEEEILYYHTGDDFKTYHWQWGDRSR